MPRTLKPEIVAEACAERKHRSSGEFIRAEILDELGLSVSAAAEVLGVRRATLSDLSHGKAALSAEMALRVEKSFGVAMEMLLLLRMQAWYDTIAMRRRARRDRCRALSVRHGLSIRCDKERPHGQIFG